MIYILLILFLAFAMLVLAAYILALIGYALFKFIDNLSYKIVTTVRGKRK